MTTEEAISYFEVRNYWLKRNPPCQNIPERIVKQELEIHRNELALSALQEQSERERGCEYCKQTINVVKMDFETDSVLGENKWFSSTRRPKFCPMCGRKLEAEQK